MERICVAIRLKPTSRQEVSSGAQWKVVANTISLHSAFGTPIKGQSYTFDTIFGASIRNAEIYEEHAKDLVLSAVSGFNGTVFAYGQTSSGKTYTMQGSASDYGVIRLAIQDVFTNIEKIEAREFLVRVSYMEIYNEEINDLLAPENRKLQVHENLERGIFVAGLREEIADSVEQVLAVLERGEAHRRFAETNMNVNSSRSHTIFRMVIESRDKSHDSTQDNDPSAQDAVRVSVLNLVDLAGSERISKTGAEGVRLKEGAHINKSLTTLGIVINKLSEGGGKQGAHIPYRDSKLTRILQSALGGNARTAIICTINPDEIHIDETRGTLQFASRAKSVTNCAQVNEILTDAALLKRQKEEIKELRRRLEGSPYSKDLKKEILHLRNDLLKYELGQEKLELELQQEIRAQVERERRIKEQEQRIENLSKMVINGAIEDRELPIKKNYRRETWCPKGSISNSLEQGLRRISSGKNQFFGPGCVDINLRTPATRRDRTFGLPPAFESLVNDESDSFWSNSSGSDTLPAYADFQNVADEDTWVSLNRGSQQEFAYIADEDTWGNMNGCHVNADSRSSHTSSESEIRRGSKQATLLAEGSSKIDMLKQQLKEMNLQYQDLQSSMEFKVQEKTEEAVAAANNALLEEKSKFQLQEIMKLHGIVRDLEGELENRNQENSRLKADTMNLHDQLLHIREALERRVLERVSVDEENEFCNQRLRSLEMRIQDDQYQQFSSASRFGDDLVDDVLEVNEISGICGTCQYSTDINSQRSSTQCGVFNSDCTFRRRPDEYKNTQLPEILMHKVNKRRLFDDKDHLTFQVEEEKDQYWNESGTRSALGNTKYNDDIRAALGRLCCRVKQLADPDVKMMESGLKQHRISQEAKSLKASLHLANRLGRELLQELHNIVNHDIACLGSHIASNGAVGEVLKTLQVLMLENAEIGLSLFHKLSSKSSLLGADIFQHIMHEVANDGASNRDVDFDRKKSANVSDGTQLISYESVYANRTKDDSIIGTGLEGCLEDSNAGCHTLVPPNTSEQSLKEVSLLSSQDPGEDICNIDLHQDCDEESGMVANCHSNVSLNVQLADEPCNTGMGQEHLPKGQYDENISEELKMMQNMSEAEKQFTKVLLNKVKALEARLTIAEMEIVEYKVEIEHLRLKNLRASVEASNQNENLELQVLRNECEMQKEEIRQLMEQVMTPDDVLERESLFRETVDRNNFLENCLKKAERRLIKAKGWREELLQLREAEARMERAYHDMKARNAALEKEGALLYQGMLKAQKISATKDGGSSEYLDGVTKLEILNEVEPLELQVLLSVGSKKRAIYSTPRKSGTTPAPYQDGSEQLKRPSCRPPRPVLGDVQSNLLQPCTPKDFGGYTCQHPDVRKSRMNDTSDKENRPCSQGLVTATY